MGLKAIEATYNEKEEEIKGLINSKSSEQSSVMAAIKSKLEEIGNLTLSQQQQTALSEILMKQMSYEGNNNATAEQWNALKASVDQLETEVKAGAGNDGNQAPATAADAVMTTIKTKLDELKTLTLPEEKQTVLSELVMQQMGYEMNQNGTVDLLNALKAKVDQLDADIKAAQGQQPVPGQGDVPSGDTAADLAAIQDKLDYIKPHAICDNFKLMVDGGQSKEQVLKIMKGPIEKAFNAKKAAEAGGQPTRVGTYWARSKCG